MTSDFDEVLAADARLASAARNRAARLSAKGTGRARASQPSFRAPRSATTPAAAQAEAANEPTRQETTRAATHEATVAERAFLIFLERGGEHGRALDDWLRAERELSRESSEAR